MRSAFQADALPQRHRALPVRVSANSGEYEEPLGIGFVSEVHGKGGGRSSFMTLFDALRFRLSFFV